HLVRNHLLARSISDAGWGQFRTILVCKAELAGKRVMLVARAYTSQDCSGCEERVQKSLSIRTQICPCCGRVLDRDKHAARNIIGAGRAQRAAVGPPGVLQRASVRL